jgi:hypothetical protein
MHMVMTLVDFTRHTILSNDETHCDTYSFQDVEYYDVVVRKELPSNTQQVSCVYTYGEIE